MNYRSILIVCLATLGLAVAGWGQADGKYVDNPADPSLPAGIGQAVTSSGEGAWVVGAIRRLTHHSDWNFSPSWSPDGRHIAFSSYRDGNWEIYVMGSDGSNPRRLTDHSSWDVRPSWSPDGRHIAFVSERYGKPKIYVMDSAGSNPRNLTNDSDWHYYPSWSPDGRHIAFVTVAGSYGKSEIYVMDSAGSNPRRLTNDSADDRSPSWSPDGRHITFVSERDGDWEIYVMDIASYTGGEPTAVAETSWGQVKSLLSTGTH